MQWVRLNHSTLYFWFPQNGLLTPQACDIDTIALIFLGDFIFVASYQFFLFLICDFQSGAAFAFLACVTFVSSFLLVLIFGKGARRKTRESLNNTKVRQVSSLSCSRHQSSSSTPGCTSPTSTTTTWPSTADFLTTLTLARRSCSGKLLTSPGSSNSSLISKSHGKKLLIFAETRGEPSTRTWSGASLLLRAALARLSSS